MQRGWDWLGSNKQDLFRLSASQASVHHFHFGFTQEITMQTIEAEVVTGSVVMTCPALDGDAGGQL